MWLTLSQAEGRDVCAGCSLQPSRSHQHPERLHGVDLPPLLSPHGNVALLGELESWMLLQVHGMSSLWKEGKRGRGVLAAN